MDVDSACPLVLHVLNQACSQQPELLKPAEEQLKQWETQPGFYTILQTIWSNHSLDQNVRWLAVLFFKNGVDRYWRKTAPNAVQEEERALLRQRLMTALTEPVNQIAVQLSVLIAKIARLDCPHNWPELFPTLLEGVKSSDTLLRQRALHILYHVVKTMATKRLAADRNIFAELTAGLFTYILTLWNGHTEDTIKYIQCQGHADLLMSFDQSILSLKVLRKLVVFGVKRAEKNESAVTFVNLVFQRLDQFLTSKNEMQFLHEDLFPRREKLITLLMKVLLDLHENQPESYISFLRPSFDLAVRYNFTDDVQGLVFERFTVNSLNLVRNILRCESYRPAKNIEDTKSPIALEANQVKLTYFNADMLPGICRRIISHYFPLTTDDLQKWDADPEDFIADEGGDSWKFSLRPCVESLFLTLMNEFWKVLTPVILSLMQEYQTPINFDDVNAILMKDAIYMAIGLASFDLYDDVDFNEWFQNHLLAELTTKHTNYRILRRRVVWVIGCWVGVKMAPEMRPMMYEALLPLLQPSEDLVVRMEVANTLRIAIDDFEFKTEQFQPYLDNSFSLLFQLLKDVVECETKMQILHVISFIIERMQREIRPHAGPLVQYLPLLWQESAEHNMLRCAILTTLMFLVQGLGVQSVSMYAFLLPIIRMSTDMNGDLHVYLCEDALDLWHTTLQECPQITPELLDIYVNVPPLLELGSDTMRISLRIIEVYVLLAPVEFLQRYSSGLVSSLASLLTDMRTEGVVVVYKFVELVLRVVPDQGPAIFTSMLPNIFKSIIEEKLYPMVASLHLSIFARIILQNPAFFWQFIEQLSHELGKSSSEVLASFLDNWFDKMDCVIQTERKKLCSLSLASMLTCNQSVVLERFGGIINVCVEALQDVCRSDIDTSVYIDAQVEDGCKDLPKDELETEHEKRKRLLCRQDPVYTVNLKEYILLQLQACQRQHGQETFSKLIDSVDVEIMQQLQEFMKV